MISQYWVGQIPARALNLQVRESSGTSKNCDAYTDFKVRILGSDNEEIDVSGSELITTFKGFGSFIFVWPKDRSLFNKSGDYLLQLEMSGPDRRDFTTAHSIRVRELGRVRN